jgi:hypothetical protein
MRTEDGEHFLIIRYCCAIEVGETEENLKNERQSLAESRARNLCKILIVS